MEGASAPVPHRRYPDCYQVRRRSPDAVSVLRRAVRRSVSGHAHDHGSAQLTDGRRPLTIVLAITGLVLLLELAGAALSGSLALLADAGHLLTDVAGLSLALVAAVLSSRPATDAR